jgi:hypothetical protein
LVRFVVQRHAVRDVEVVEVWVDGVFKATIVPDDGDGIRVISRWFTLRPASLLQLEDRVEAWRLLFRK